MSSFLTSSLNYESELFIGGGEARNHLIRNNSKSSPEHLVELDRDYIWISEEDIPEELQKQIDDDISVSPSIKEYMATRDVSINQVLFNPKTKELIASELAVKDAQQGIVRQLENSLRSFLRTLRFAVVYGFQPKTLHDLDFYSPDEDFGDWEYFERQVVTQLLRAGQAGKFSEYRRALEEVGVNLDSFEYYPDLLPDWSLGREDDEDSEEDFQQSILDKVPKEYEKYLGSKLHFLSKRIA